MNDLDRRKFLGGTAGLAAGLFLAGGSASAQEGDKPIRAALMGCGGRGRSLANTFGKQKGLTVATVCDPDGDRMAVAATEIGKRSGTDPKAEGDIRKVLDDDSIDVIIVAAPNHWHGPATIMAAGAGKHVYVEKPCCHNPAEGEMMIAAGKKNNVCIQVGTQRRSNEAIAEAIKLVHDGAIGEAYYGRSWYANQRGTIGTGKQMDPPKELQYALWEGPAPHVPYQDNFLHYNWHWFWHWGNGELGNNGTHSIDLCRWALQVDYPTRVVSSGGRYAFDDDQETPDTHVVSYEFDGDKQLMWEGISCNRHGMNKTGFGATVHGTDGTMEINASGYVHWNARGQEVQKKSTGNAGDNTHIANLLTAIRANDPSLLNCNILEGHRSTLLTQLGNIAHRTGRTLTCSKEDGKIQGDDEAMALWQREYAEGWAPKV